MSTSYNNISGSRIATLAASHSPFFHTNDLAALLDIPNANTLRVTLYRLVKAGILHRIHRGLFSLMSVDKIDPVLLGSACLHRFNYLTTESVLREEGYILQSIDALTFVSDVSRTWTVQGHRFVSRRLHPRFLHNAEGIQHVRGMMKASPERAIADMLYFDPWYHFDKPVYWKRISALQKIIGYPLTPHRYADSPRS